MLMLMLLMFMLMLMLWLMLNGVFLVQVPLGGFATLQGMRGIQKFNIHKAFGGSHLLPAAHTWCVMHAVAVTRIVSLYIGMSTVVRGSLQR